LSSDDLHKVPTGNLPAAGHPSNGYADATPVPKREHLQFQWKNTTNFPQIQGRKNFSAKAERIKIMFFRASEMGRIIHSEVFFAENVAF
jgi:hypothetical protein